MCHYGLFLLILLLTRHGFAKRLTFPLRHHEQVAQERRLEAQLAPVYQGYGTHYVDLWVGCPVPQRQTLIVDTGSGQTAFPCSKCVDCGINEQHHIDPAYQEDKSSCFRYIQTCEECRIGPCHKMTRTDPTNVTTGIPTATEECRMSNFYAEGSSWQALEAVDKVYAGGNHDEPAINAAHSFDLHFGCQYNVTGLFKVQIADGIMGMLDGPSSFWRQAYRANAIDSPSFSLCFIRALEAQREGTGAGALVLGGTDERLHQTPMVYAKMNVNAQTFFSVALEKMYLRSGGGESIAVRDNTTAQYTTVVIKATTLNGNGVIVDSGTTATYFSKELIKPFENAWKKVTGEYFNYEERKMTKKQLLALPTIVLQMTPADDNARDPTIPGIAGDLDSYHPNSVLVAFPPTHYLRYIAKSGTYAPQIFFTIEASDTQVLGANFFAGKDIYFDVDHARIGFAESRCDFHEMGEPNFEYTDSSSLHHEIVDFAYDDDEVFNRPTATPPPRHPPAPKGPVTIDEVDYANGGAQCSSSTCQWSLFLVFVAWVVIVSTVLMRRVPTDESEPFTPLPMMENDEESDNDGHSSTSSHGDHFVDEDAISAHADDGPDV